MGHNQDEKKHIQDTHQLDKKKEYQEKKSFWFHLSRKCLIKYIVHHCRKEIQLHFYKSLDFKTFRIQNVGLSLLGDREVLP